MLADPFHLGDEIPAWQAPLVLPTVKGLRAVIAELERCTQPAPNKHIEHLVATMARSMAMRQGTTLDMALRTAGWIVACGDLPADLWTEGCTEILRSNTFFPAPAELLGIVGPKWGERKRMLERARSLLKAHGEAAEPKPPAPFVPEPRRERLLASIASYRRFGREADADRVQRIVDREDGLEVAPVDIKPAELVSKPAPETPSQQHTRLVLAERARQFRERQGFQQPKPPVVDVEYETADAAPQPDRNLPPDSFEPVDEFAEVA